MLRTRGISVPPRGPCARQRVPGHNRAPQAECKEQPGKERKQEGLARLTALQGILRGVQWTLGNTEGVSREPAGSEEMSGAEGRPDHLSLQLPITAGGARRGGPGLSTWEAPSENLSPSSPLSSRNHCSFPRPTLRGVAGTS